MKIRPATGKDATSVAIAIDALILARTHLAAAGCVKAAEKVRRALKSAEGARRHVWHRINRMKGA